MSGGGSGNTDDRLRGNTLTNVATGRNVQCLQEGRHVQISEVGPSAHHGVHMQAGRVSQTSGKGAYTPGSVQGFDTYRNSEQANPIQHVPSPQHYTQLFSVDEPQAPAFAYGGSSYQLEAGGRPNTHQLTAFNGPLQASWGPVRTP